jgi:hypothetical protein
VYTWIALIRKIAFGPDANILSVKFAQVEESHSSSDIEVTTNLITPIFRMGGNRRD